MTKLPLWDVKLGTINRLYSDPKKTVILNHYLRITATSPKQQLYSVPKLAIVERFDSRYFWSVQNTELH